MTFRLVYDDGEQYTMGDVVDISENGALVQGPSPARLGQSLSLVPIGHAGDILFDVRAKVVRVIRMPGPPEHYRLGLDFRSVDPARRRALMRLFEAMPQTDEAEIAPEAPVPVSDEGFGGSVEHHRIRQRMPPPKDPRRQPPTL